MATQSALPYCLTVHHHDQTSHHHCKPCSSVLHLNLLGVPQGHFPRMENIAAFKPVSTSPARSSCGVPGRSSYCRAPSGPLGLLSCSRAFCDQECPWRSTTAPYAPLLLPAHRWVDQTRLETTEGHALYATQCMLHVLALKNSTQHCVVSYPSYPVLYTGNGLT